MKVVLHICCGVCAAGAAKQLLEEGHTIYGYFYNPNIHPSDEYVNRYLSAQKVADELGFILVEGDYDPAQWLRETAHLAGEKEGGKRCRYCYKVRLGKTYEYMREIGADAFTTTLTVGPGKSASVVNEIGKKIGGDKFLVRDFKKKEGFKKANEIARNLGIYRQDYCGCIYSKPDK